MADDGLVYLLSLDGGGIRGISELVILHEIMKRLKEVAGLKEEPKPRGYFHLIGGTSTGGTFKEATLDKVIRDIVAQRRLEKTVMLDTGGEKGVTFVCAATYNDHTPYLFRTYRANSSQSVPVADAPGTMTPTHNHAHHVEIWEAARATTAAPTFFHPISIKIKAEMDAYVDGALRFNNPARLVLNEAESQFGSGRKLGFVLSLGTGLKTADKGSNVVPSMEEVARNTEPVRKNSGALLSRGTFKVLKHAKQSITDPEPAHSALEERFRGTPYAYFRLNLDRGAADIKLHEYKKIKALRAATEQYLRKVQVFADIDKVVSMLHNNEGVNMPLDAAFYRLVRIAVCARSVHSLALSVGFANFDTSYLRFARVFWNNAATEDCIYESPRLMTATLFGGEPSKPDIGRVLQWLERNTKEEWLLVFDNNDSIDSRADAHLDRGVRRREGRQKPAASQCGRGAGNDDAARGPYRQGREPGGNVVGVVQREP
ncbi:acyl transferase/acyl hydrolase/lysophospholipase [Colletotrichum navitas]|uniref:Acyl transferase/acyl hydrolase/lysophospholipase n=1 Tax=Colletotrichum navitas TaxID=681940 RepID=A0AAD8VBN3_9PEZI|nr:acyl transferase/acyl hydrolase/lysophospholipase [Colletotrichum navitas]KAK1600469.1 acyl transferase/acyl hydrolase/lysophospholipase [Colletotrichum navitas]